MRGFGAVLAYVRVLGVVREVAHRGDQELVQTPVELERAFKAPEIDPYRLGPDGGWGALPAAPQDATQMLQLALSTGTTTVVGGGTGPTEGSKATLATPGSWWMERMLEGFDPWPVNVLFLGRGNTVSLEAMREQLRGGVGGGYVHAHTPGDAGAHSEGDAAAHTDGDAAAHAEGGASRAATG